MRENTYKLDHYHWKTHVLFWAASVLGWVLLAFTFSGEFYEPLINKLCYLPSQILVTYVLINRVLPSFLNGLYLKSGSILLMVTYVATVFARIFKVYIYETLLHEDLEKNPIVEILTQIPPLMVQYVIWVYLTPVSVLTTLIILNHLRQKEHLETLLKEKSIAELRVLKSQVQPHFLFNTLNNLYTLAIKQSSKTSVIAGKLYDILDYMFNKCNAERISIQEEINLLSNYIDLEKIRYGDRLNVSFVQEVDDMSYKLAPLLLLSLIENAFKHGASSDVGNPIIRINLRLENSHFSMSIYNSKPSIVSHDIMNKVNGIGLQNVRKQLDLIYSNRYSFEIDQNETFYMVQLELFPLLKVPKLGPENVTTV